ncbi:hypothetical protein KCH_35190 [Kitasatospora cheerisanensis KCTC 2395]|uniref:Uncharacterized protein n=1 Tax=Kitasatospora cheerisanensis KCTC 2395 TaxID=1348663 RepID=A0A066Z339_9ACTN|nr:hypothetical protein KCH_35190 [Kitasatospora cheerisanensis KCTC 2395]
MFTGFGHWTGLSIGALSLPVVPKASLPDAGDFLWGVPLAVAVAVVWSLVRRWATGSRRSRRSARGCGR